MQKKELSWLMHPWIAHGNLHLVTGSPNSGKSTFGAYLFSLARTIIYIPSIEQDDELLSLPRWEAHFVDRSKVKILPNIGANFLMHKEDIMEVIRHYNADLLWVEKFDDLIPPDGEGTGEVIKTMLHAMSEIATKTQAAVVGIRHPGKVVRNILPGSRHWRIIPRMVIEIIYDKGPPETRICRAEKDSLMGMFPKRYVNLTGVKGRPPVWRWGEEVPDGKIEELDGVPDSFDRWKIDQAEELIKQILKNGPADAADIYRRCDQERLNERTVRRAARRMGVFFERVGSGTDHKCVWHIKKPTQATPDS